MAKWVEDFPGVWVLVEDGVGKISFKKKFLFPFGRRQKNGSLKFS